MHPPRETHRTGSIVMPAHSQTTPRKIYPVRSTATAMQSTLGDPTLLWLQAGIAPSRSPPFHAVSVRRSLRRSSSSTVSPTMKPSMPSHAIALFSWRLDGKIGPFSFGEIYRVCAARKRCSRRGVEYLTMHRQSLRATHGRWCRWPSAWSRRWPAHARDRPVRYPTWTPVPRVSPARIY